MESVEIVSLDIISYGHSRDSRLLRLSYAEVILSVLKQQTTATLTMMLQPSPSMGCDSNKTAEYGHFCKDNLMTMKKIKHHVSICV